MEEEGQPCIYGESEWIEYGIERVLDDPVQEPGAAIRMVPGRHWRVGLDTERGWTSGGENQVIG